MFESEHFQTLLFSLYNWDSNNFECRIFFLNIYLFIFLALHKSCNTLLHRYCILYIVYCWLAAPFNRLKTFYIDFKKVNCGSYSHCVGKSIKQMIITTVCTQIWSLYCICVKDWPERDHLTFITPFFFLNSIRIWTSVKFWNVGRDCTQRCKRTSLQCSASTFQLYTEKGTSCIIYLVATENKQYRSLQTVGGNTR